MRSAGVRGRAPGGIGRVVRDGVFVDVIAVRGMEVTVVEVVDMVAVPYGDVFAVAVHVLVRLVNCVLHTGSEALRSGRRKGAEARRRTCLDKSLKGPSGLQRSGVREARDHVQENRQRRQREPAECDGVDPSQFDVEAWPNGINEHQAPRDKLEADARRERDRRDPEARLQRTPAAGRAGARTRCHAISANTTMAESCATPERQSPARGRYP